MDNCVCVQHSTARMCAGVCSATLLPAGMAGREPTRADLLQPTAVEMSVEVEVEVMVKALVKVEVEVEDKVSG